MYETIKKFLEEGGKCLLIENGKPIGVVLTMEEYEKLQNKSEPRNEELIPGIEEFAEGEGKIPGIRGEAEKEKPVTNPIGATMVEEMFPDLTADPRFAVGFGEARAFAKAEASANIDEINLADAGDVTLEDLDLDELPY